MRHWLTTFPASCEREKELTCRNKEVAIHIKPDSNQGCMYTGMLARLQLHESVYLITPTPQRRSWHRPHQPVLVTPSPVAPPAWPFTHFLTLSAPNTPPQAVTLKPLTHYTRFSPSVSESQGFYLKSFDFWSIPSLLYLKVTMMKKKPFYFLPWIERNVQVAIA